MRVNEAEPYARLAAVYDEIVVDPCHRVWASYLHELWSSDPAQVHSVLDLGCGTGLMAAALTAYGYRVTGVDSSAAMLARARRLLGPEAVLIQRAMPGLGVGGVFDAVISTFDALNYLSTPEFGATVAAVARRLRPGGWLVFDLHTTAMLDFTMANPVVAGTADGQHFTHQQRRGSGRPNMRHPHPGQSRSRRRRLRRAAPPVLPHDRPGSRRPSGRWLRVDRGHR